LELFTLRKYVRILHSSLYILSTTSTTNISTLSLHDALPIFSLHSTGPGHESIAGYDIRSVSVTHPGGALAYRIRGRTGDLVFATDRKSTRLNSSHVEISYAVFCLKKKMIYII